jgi:hypothetical protein
MGRGEVSKKCRDIRNQENRDPVILENPRIDHSRKSREDTCQNPGGSRNSENRELRGHAPVGSARAETPIGVDTRGKRPRSWHMVICFKS